MVKKTLRNEEANEEKKDRVVLYEPHSFWWGESEYNLSSERAMDLQPKFQHLKKALAGHNLVLMTSKGEVPLPRYFQEILTRPGDAHKTDMAKALAFFLGDYRNFHAYIECLDAKVRKVWDLVIDKYYVSRTTLRQATGDEWFTVKEDKKYYYSYKVELSDELPWFSVTKADIDDKHSHYYLYLPFYQDYIYQAFSSERAKAFPPLAKLPKEENLHVFNDEIPTCRMLPALENLHRQGMLTVNKFKMAATNIQKASAVLNGSEFFPENKDKAAAQLRMSALLTAYSINRTAIKKEKTPEDIIKALLEKALSNPAALLALSLPHISAEIKASALSSGCVSAQARHILELLTTCKSGRWMDVECIRLKLYGVDEARSYNLLLPEHILQRTRFTNTKHKRYVPLDEISNDFVNPFIKGFLFLMAAFGIVEVAYEDYDPMSPSYFCALRYVRLTALGEYVLEVKKEYQPETNEEILFEVNADNLIVRSTAEPNPYQPLITDIGIPISAHRYKVTPASFLSSCKKQDDIEKKISIFRRFVCKDPPQIWEDFFRSILQRCKPMKRVDMEKYIIYRLKAEDKELQHLVSTDAYLRQYTKRAEDYLLLIEIDHLDKVISRLKSFGYLL